MKRVLSFGGGVDSSAILAYHLFEENLNIDHVVFADTGAESADTYRNVEFFRALRALRLALHRRSQGRRDAYRMGHAPRDRASHGRRLPRLQQEV